MKRRIDQDERQAAIVCSILEWKVYEPTAEWWGGRCCQRHGTGWCMREVGHDGLHVYRGVEPKLANVWK